MKIIIALVFTTLTMGAFAQEDLSMMKMRANSRLDEKITSLQTAKSCVNNATSVEKFKACKYDMHENMKMQKMEEKKKEIFD